MVLQMPHRLRFMKQLGDLAFNGSGFAVLKAWAPDTTGLVAEYANVNLQPIFNSAENDFKRQQTLLCKNSSEKHIKNSSKTSKWLQLVLGKISKESQQRYVGDVALLRSAPRCKPQMAHCDYVPEPDLLKSSDATVPHLLLIALQDETTLNIWPGSHRVVRGSYFAKKLIPVSHVVLNKGDALLFRGDLVHAGSAFAKSNTRVHFYLDTRVVRRAKDVTWIVSQHASPQVAAFIDETVHDTLHEDRYT